jgi:hypothetical protein
VWFDVPNYLDHRRGVLDTEFGFRVDRAGEVELRLSIIPIDRKRFRWDMVETIEIGPDDRRESPLAPRRGLPARSAVAFSQRAQRRGRPARFCGER